MESVDLSLKCLTHFCGNTMYYEGYLGVNLTEGAQYVEDNGYAWLVSDICSVVKIKLKEHLFVSIKGKIHKKGIIVTYTDGNSITLFKQKYSYSDAKRNIEFFFTNNVLMLCSEY